MESTNPQFNEFQKLLTEFRFEYRTLMKYAKLHDWDEEERRALHIQIHAAAAELLFVSNDKLDRLPVHGIEKARVETYPELEDPRRIFPSLAYKRPQ